MAAHGPICKSVLGVMEAVSYARWLHTPVQNTYNKHLIHIDHNRVRSDQKSCEDQGLSVAKVELVGSIGW